MLGDGAQPAAMKSAFVNNSGAATNNKTLKISAKMIDPAAAAVPPFFISSLARFWVGTGKSPGRAPVTPAKSPSPSMTAGVRANSTSAASAW
ncbi:MAG: hypothetical protein DMG97_43770 [Acidobacteria bacterium]|nr:MAG: hypothetical protein DMG97_43770 [Acidobacteriota bacterium]